MIFVLWVLEYNKNKKNLKLFRYVKSMTIFAAAKSTTFGV